MAEMAMRVAIRGQVQGVSFRAWTQGEAERRGLTGWVRNRTDGSVEAVFAGDEAAVMDMIAACRKGPPAAKVEDVSMDTANHPGGCGFEVLPTA